jgi:UPF0176 protein
MSNNVVVCALYKFAVLNDYKDLRQPLLNLMQQNGVHGTLLLAREGINGTIAGTREGIDAIKEWIGQDQRFDGIDYKESLVDIQPFKRTKVKLKKEIVTMGVEGIDPKRIVGTYVDPKAWNDLVSDPDVLVSAHPETPIFSQFSLSPKMGTELSAFKKNEGGQLLVGLAII